MDTIRIGDACEILNGYAFKSDQYVADGIRIIRIANVQNGYIEDNTPAFYPIDSTGLDRYMLEEGDLLMSLTGNVGRVAILEAQFLPAALNQRVACLRLKTNKISKGYLFHILNSDFFEKRCIESSKGVAQKNMSTEWLKNYDIPLYTKEEQIKIEEILDRIREIITSRKTELQKLDNLIKARFVELFGDCRLNPKGWKTIALGDIADVGSSKRVFVEELKETGIPFFRGTEVGALAEGKTITPELFITEEHYDELIKATGKPAPGDLLMPSICPDGRIWVVDTDKPFYFKDGRVLWVHGIDKNFDPVFLLYTLKDRIMADYGSIASGTTFAELKIFALKQCQVFDVPIEKQRNFVAFITQVDKSKVIKEINQIIIINSGVREICQISSFYRRKKNMTFLLPLQSRQRGCMLQHLLCAQ